MENKFTIQLGKYKIVAEVNDMDLPLPSIPAELFVYIEDEDGRIIQDICVVRPHYEIDRKTMEFKTYDDFVDCLVWGESGNEDYTDKHVIAVYEEEEE